MKAALHCALVALAAACSDGAGGSAVGLEGAASSASKPPSDAGDSAPIAASTASAVPLSVAASSERLSELRGSRLEWGDGSPRWAQVPSLRMGATSVSGGLSQDVIQRIVRPNFGLFRLCYEDALTLDGDLEGTITVSWAIEADSSVKDLKAESDLKDKTFVECVRKAFGRIGYPKPQGGVVRVRYPLLFSPPHYNFTIHGKHSHDVLEDDVKQALLDANYSVVTSGPKPGFPEATVFAIEKDAIGLTLTFDPNGSLEGGTSRSRGGPRRPTREYERLAKEAVLLTEGRLILAAECPNRAAAKMLLDAIARPSPDAAAGPVPPPR